MEGNKHGRRKKLRKSRAELAEYERLMLQGFNPELEAASFYACYLRTGQMEKLRVDIGVSERVVSIWQAMSDEGDWDAMVALGRMLPLRRKTLALFDHLVTTGGRRDFA